MITKKTFLSTFGLCFILGLPAGAQDAIDDDAMRAITAAVNKAAQGQMDQAITDLEAMVQAGRDSEPVIATLGALYVEAGQPEKGLELLTPMAQAEGANPGVLYNAGRAAFMLGRLDEAGNYLRRSVESAGTVSPATRELGLLRIQQGHFFRAFILLRPWVDTHPQDTQARIGAAMCAVELERAPEAEAYLSDLDQDNPLVRLLWARTLLLTDDPWGALALLKPLIEDAPEDLEQDVRRVMAQAQLGIGRPEEALELLEGQDRQDPFIARLMSQAFEDSGDIDGALVVSRPFADLALETEGDDSAGLPPELAGSFAFEYGRLMARKNQHEQAIPYLQLAVKIDPSNQTRWEELSRAQTALGRDQAAATTMSRAQELAESESQLRVGFNFAVNPDDPTGQQLLKALELAEKQSLSEALSLVQQETMLASPDDPRPAFVETRILLLLGRLPEAEAVAEGLTEDYPFNADVYYQKAVVEMAQEDLASAESDLTKALELAPEHTAALNDLAVLKMQLNKNQEAQDLLERLLTLNPDDAVAAQNLEKLRQGS